MKKISEQLRIQAIWHDSVYGYYEYIGTSNALITSTGTKFSKSVKTSIERFLMVYLSANMTRRQNSLYHEFVKIEDQMYLLTWYMKGQKIAGNLIPLQRILMILKIVRKATRFCHTYMTLIMKIIFFHRMSVKRRLEILSRGL